MQIFPYSDDPNKRYHTWNYALRQQFVKRFLKCQLMVALIAPIVMGRLPKVVVRSVVFLAQAT